MMYVAKLHRCWTIVILEKHHMLKSFLRGVRSCPLLILTIKALKSLETIRHNRDTQDTTSAQSNP